MRARTDPVRPPDALPAGFASSVQALVGRDPSCLFGVAVSGGPDSMALLHLAGIAFPGRVAAATVDHGLRPASAGEAAMVAQWCAAHAVPHATLVPGARPTGNIQAWGRAQRYALLGRWRLERGIDWIMTAHHADDQVETVMMRLNRGAGVGGLAGVRARAGHVVRPLLRWGKAQLLAYARHHHLPFVQDPSNADPRFDRATLRTALAGVDWIDRQSVARSAAALAEAEEALEWAADQLFARHGRCDGGACWLDRTDLPREMVRRMVMRMIRTLRPDMASPRGDTIDRAIAAAMAGGQSSIGDLILKGGECWTLRPAPPRRAIDAPETGRGV
ncbi:MAG: tRNA lysidine(34) synthetase TilS [Sphingobium sp.]